MIFFNDTASFCRPCSRRISSSEKYAQEQKTDFASYRTEYLKNIRETL